MVLWLPNSQVTVTHPQTQNLKILREFMKKAEWPKTLRLFVSVWHAHCSFHLSVLEYVVATGCFWCLTGILPLSAHGKTKPVPNMQH